MIRHSSSFFHWLIVCLQWQCMVCWLLIECAVALYKLPIRSTKQLVSSSQVKSSHLHAETTVTSILNDLPSHLNTHTCKFHRHDSTSSVSFIRSISQSTTNNNSPLHQRMLILLMIRKSIIWEAGYINVGEDIAHFGTFTAWCVAYSWRVTA